MEHTVEGAVGAAIRGQKLQREDVSNEIYERVKAAAQQAFGQHWRVATAYHNAEHAAKRELIEAMPTKSKRPRRSTGEELSKYERDRLRQIKDNKDMLSSLEARHSSMPADAVVLWVQKKWLDMILAGQKTMEIRTCHLRKHLNKHVHLAESESKMVKATVFFTESLGPLSQTEWESHMDRHCCGNTRYYTYPKANYGWSFNQLNVLPSAISINRPAEAQRWQTGKWGD